MPPLTLAGRLSPDSTHYTHSLFKELNLICKASSQQRRVNARFQAISMLELFTAPTVAVRFHSPPTGDLHQTVLEYASIPTRSRGQGALGDNVHLRSFITHDSIQKEPSKVVMQLVHILIAVVSSMETR